jgi:hypothetical protein
MPTPASGAISMNNMNTEITRASGTATVSMNTIRTRYGGSGAISFNDLRKAEGFTVTCGTYVSKFINFDGWNVYLGTGSVSPNENAGHLQFATNSFLSDLNAGTGSDTNASVGIRSDTSGTTTGITVGFRATDVTRIVTQDVSRTLGSAPEEFYRFFTYDVPSSGTITCLIKF